MLSEDSQLYPVSSDEDMNGGSDTEFYPPQDGASELDEASKLGLELLPLVCIKTFLYVIPG
jgi:hypothetical protein